MKGRPAKQAAQTVTQQVSPLPIEPPATRDLFRKLETLESELESSGQTGHSRWMVPYADLLTLLLGLFLVLFTASSAELGQKTDTKPVALQNSQKTLKNSQTVPMNDSIEVHHQQAQARDTALAAKLQTQMNTLMKSEDVEIRQQERGLVISLKDSILFAPGSAELSASARKTLNRLVERLASVLAGQDRPIRVEGHTDNTPITTAKYPSNWELSTARATNIVRYLVASHQLPPEQLSAAGYGEFKPIRENSSIEGKQKNRRVDIVILNDNTAQQEPPALSTKAAPENGGR